MQNEKSLSRSFGDSLQREVVDCIGTYAEIGLDTIMEDGVYKEIPFLSTAISIYHIGQTVRDRHNIRKLAAFVDEVNKQIEDERTRESYIASFQNDEKVRKRELEYILILIDRYLDDEKPRILAELYLAYLRREIEWSRFAEFAEIIDRLLFSDYCCLFEFMCNEGVVVGKTDVELSSVLRLLAVGFVSQQQSAIAALTGSVDPRDEFDYMITSYGRQFAGILEYEIRKIHAKEKAEASTINQKRTRLLLKKQS